MFESKTYESYVEAMAGCACYYGRYVDAPYLLMLAINGCAGLV